MNRAERRRLKREKDKNDVTYNSKYGELKSHVDTMVDKKKDEFIADAALNVVAGTLLTLHDEFGFGEKRIKKFMDNFNELYDSITKGYLSLEDVKEELLKYNVNLGYK